MLTDHGAHGAVRLSVLFGQTIHGHSVVMATHRDDYLF